MATMPTVTFDRDAYPFNVTRQGGRANRPSVKVISAAHNQLQGSLPWNRFCRPRARNMQIDDAHTVVPIPVNHVPTLG